MPDFPAVARAYGLDGFTITEFDQFKKIIQDYKTVNQTLLFDITVIENENCYPMVAPGRSNAQMLGLEK